MKTCSALKLSSLAWAPCLLSVSTVAAAATAGFVQCSPSAIPTGNMVMLKGNCIDTLTSQELSSGAEVWRVRSSESSEAVGARALPNGSLNVTAPTIPGEYVYYVTTIDEGYGGMIDLANGEAGYPSVTVTVAGPGTPAPVPATQASLHQLTTALTTLQTSRMSSHLAQAQSRLRTLRTSKSMPRFDVQGVPLPESKKEGDAETGERRFAVYLGGVGDYLRQNASGEQSAFKARTTSLSIGADYRLSDAWVMGGNVGLSDSHVSFSGSQSDQKSKGHQATVYASWSLSEASYLSATLSYEASKFDLTRDAGGKLSFASPRGHGLGISLTGGRDFVMGPWSIGPYVRWDNVTSDVDAFTETGSAAAVAISAQRTRSNTLNAGAQTQFSVPVSWGVVLPYVRLELSHRNDTTRESATATLLSDNTTLLIPTAVDTNNDYGTAALGVSGVNQGGISWFIDYETGFAQNSYRTRRFGVGLRFEL